MSAGIEWVDDDWPDDPPAAAVALPVVAGELFVARRTGERCCVRLNCDERGLPAQDSRCPRCDHPTQPLANYRFPRTVFS